MKLTGSGRTHEIRDLFKSINQRINELLKYETKRQIGLNKKNDKYKENKW